MNEILKTVTETINLEQDRKFGAKELTKGNKEIQWRLSTAEQIR